MKSFVTSCIVVVLLSNLLFGQTAISPKREFRAAWVASVTNLDFPTSTGATVSSLKSQMTTMLDQLKALGFNAIVFQIRPECDALYESSLEPWSYWISGVQGTGPGSGFDPLTFTIDESHKRGMELHAWFNPYRAERSVGNYTTAANHVTKAHPEWILTFGTLKMLDPGIPSARNHVASVIADVIRRYNVDAIHWDDYFYPYAPNSITNQDDSSFIKYNPTAMIRADWRRNNVNSLIKMVKDSITVLKPWVKFGISPFGIWKNGVPTGIIGTSGYSELYCDAVYWMKQNYLDYLTPQLYWVIGGSQDYSKLMPWWNSQMNGHHLYPGQAAYRISSWTAAEVPNQMNLNRTTLNPSGNVFFRAKLGVIDNPKGFADSLKNNFYKYPALIPAMPWKDSIPPNSPVNVVASATVPTGVWLQWQKPGKAIDNDTAKYFVIYRAQFPDTINLNDVRQIRFITLNDTDRFVDAFVTNGQKYSYIVTSMDKLNNESDPSQKVSVVVTGVEEITLLPQEFRVDQNYPNPFNPVTTIRFQLNKQDYTSVKIYDLLGREIATIVDGVLEIGMHTYQFSGENLASGVYIYRVVSGANVAAKRMVLQK